MSRKDPELRVNIHVCSCWTFGISCGHLKLFYGSTSWNLATWDGNASEYAKLQQVERICVFCTFVKSLLAKLGRFEVNGLAKFCDSRSKKTTRLRRNKICELKRGLVHWSPTKNWDWFKNIRCLLISLILFPCVAAKPSKLYKSKFWHGIRNCIRQVLT